MTIVLYRYLYSQVCYGSGVEEVPDEVLIL